MTIVADTNLLVRLLVDDDPRQRDLCLAEFDRAERIILTLPALCELCWVLTSRYRLTGADIAPAIAALLDQPKIAVDHAAVRAGLAMIEAGGDFADGVIAQEGRDRGGATFLSFDQKAVRLLTSQGHAARSPMGS